jgi:hypothetical protein
VAFTGGAVGHVCGKTGAVTAFYQAALQQLVQTLCVSVMDGGQ